MFKQMIIVALVACCVNAQIPSFGGCPKVDPKPFFSWDAFSGKWYQSSKVPNFYEGLDKCTTLVFDGVAPNVKFSVSAASFDTTVFRNYSAQLTVGDTSIGSFSALFPNSPFGLSLPMKIVHTDYLNYAVLYACQDFLGLFKLEYAWILSRSRFLLPIFSESTNSSYDLTKLSRNLLIPTDQFQCPLVYTEN